MSQTVAEWTLHKLANPNCHCEQCESVPVHPTDVDRRCELINGQPIHPLLVAAVLGLPAFDTPALRRYVMEAKSRNLAKGATTAHTAWKDRPPSPRHRPKRQQDRSSNNDDDPDDDDSDRWF